MESLCQQISVSPAQREDMAQRYKMPVMQIAIEGKGNGIRTHFMNCKDVAKALNIPPQYIARWIAIDLGRNFKSNEDFSKLMVTGESTQQEIQDSLDKFIEKYILCPKCRDPEIQIYIKKKSKKELIIKAKCNACPFHGRLDNQHKLARYIQQNPPTDQTRIKEAPKTEEKVDAEGDDAVNIESHNVIDALIQSVREVYKTFDGQTFEDNKEAYDQISAVMNAQPLQDKQIVYVLFNAIFDMDIAQQIERNAPLMIRVLQQQEIEEKSMDLEIFMNLQHFLLDKHEKIAEEVYVEAIPTFLYHFYSNELLLDNFVEEFSQKELPSELKSKMKKHWLYNKKQDHCFRRNSKKFRTWILKAEYEEYNEKKEEESKVDNE